MAIRLMSLRGVPDDELEEICALLDEHNITYYMTQAGNWLISAGAIWLTDKDQLHLARQLLNDYQHQRCVKAREEYHQSQRSSVLAGIYERIIENPLRFIAYLAIIIFVLYVSVMPFLDYGQ